jgi:DNA (cytosine-5)-methyltransferase 1
MLKVLDLFSGIGGFSLGLERTGGFKTVAFCEIEPYPRKVLAKHWPEVPCYRDVRELTADRLAADGIGVDVICGGFPCQDISVAGKGAGMAGERSGLWSEFARLIGELRPRYAIVENVSALLSRGLADVLGDLATLGYDAEWHCIPASAVGAPHRRDRIWIVAHARRRLKPQQCNSDQMFDGWECSKEPANPSGGSSSHGGAPPVADANCPEWWEDIAPRRSIQRENGLSQGQESSGGLGSNCQAVANADDQRQLQSQGRKCDEWGWASDDGKDVPNASGSGLPFARSQPDGTNRIIGRGMLTANSWWLIEPDVGRVANGVSNRVHRLKGLGNAVVPQIPELIGRAILAAGI